MASGRGVAFAERGEEGRPWTELQCPSDLIPNRSYLKVQQFDGRVHFKGWPRRRKVVIGAGAVFDARRMK